MRVCACFHSLRVPWGCGCLQIAHDVRMTAHHNLRSSADSGNSAYLRMTRDGPQQMQMPSVACRCFPEIRVPHAMIAKAFQPQKIIFQRVSYSQRVRSSAPLQQLWSKQLGEGDKRPCKGFSGSVHQLHTPRGRDLHHKNKALVRHANQDPEHKDRAGLMPPPHHASNIFMLCCKAAFLPLRAFRSLMVGKLAVGEVGAEAGKA